MWRKGITSADSFAGGGGGSMWGVNHQNLREFLLDQLQSPSTSAFSKVTGQMLLKSTEARHEGNIPPLLLPPLTHHIQKFTASEPGSGFHRSTMCCVKKRFV